MTGPRAHRWLRFIISGGTNTGFTYLVYLGLCVFVRYQVAYLFAYATGVVLSYWLNARVVFQVPLSWRGLFLYPIVHLAQYAVSALLFGSLIECIGLRQNVAPLVVPILTLPITYLMSELALREKRQRVK